MINLLEVEDMFFEQNGKIGIQLYEGFKIALCDKKLELCREKGNGDLIYTQNLRNVGKTTALIKFAKKYDYAVIVPHGAEDLRRKYDYKSIYNINNLESARGLYSFNMVIDEGVDINKIENKIKLFHIVTGFTDNINNKQENKTNPTFDNEVEDVLKGEIKELTYKIKKARQEENWGTYKNLITAYTNVLELIKGNKEDKLIAPLQQKNFDRFMELCVSKGIIRNYLNDKLQDTLDDIDISICTGQIDTTNELIKKKDNMKAEINELNSKIKPLDKLIYEAEKCVGRPYTWGGNSYEMGFDCSGLVEYLYAQINIEIPRCTYDQVKQGVKINKYNLGVGDLLFFGDKDEPHHVGMYMGNNKYVNVTHTGENVQMSELKWNEVTVAKRIIT